ncbi:MAG: LD-carboxypeptidase [Rhodothermales bacterium]|nr:LD-carboxypeptidase [Rhodothermales bacterium]
MPRPPDKVSAVRPLRPGGTVGVVAPASAPANESDLEAGLARLRNAGFNVVTAFDMDKRDGYLADSDSDRLHYLNEMLARDDIAALFCARGGFGALRILSGIDFNSLRRAPKIIVGYSDITAIHLAALAQTGLPGLSAAMVSTDWKDIATDEEKAILACLAGTAADGVFAPDGLALTAERSGEAEGRSIGGNLSVLCKLVGSRYFPDPTDAILFIEEVGEPPYRIDGLLAQLHLSGVLDRIGGLVIGGITDAEPPDGKPSLMLDDILNHYFDLVDGPVASGLSYGHFQPKVPMPVGTRMRLNVRGETARLVALEQLVPIA